MRLYILQGLPLVLAASVLTLAEVASAQPVMVGSQGALWNPTFTFQYSDIAAAHVRSPGTGEGGTLESVSREMGVSIPFFGKGTDTTLGFGLAARALTLHFTGFAPVFAPSLVSDLYGVSAQLNILHRVDNDRSWLVFVSMADFSDTWPVEGQDRTGAGFFLNTRTSPTTVWGLGAVYTYLLGAPMVLPAFNYTHRDGPWSANVRLPAFADVRYSLTERLRIGGLFQIQGGEYTVTSSSTSVDKARYSAASIGALISYGPIQLTAGQTLYRQYQTLTGTMTVVNWYFNPSASYSAGLFLRF